MARITINDLLFEFYWNLLCKTHCINKYSHYCNYCHSMVYINFQTEMDCIKCKYNMITKLFYMCDCCRTPKNNYVSIQEIHVKMCEDFSKYYSDLKFKLREEICKLRIE